MKCNYSLCHDYELFNELSTEQFHAVSIYCREGCFYPETILFEDGEPAQKMYVLVEGEIKLYYAIGEAGMVEVDKVAPGGIFGCSALVPPYIHPSTALAKTRIEVLELDAVGLRGLFDDDPRLAVSIQQHVMRCLLDCIINLRLG